MSTQEFYIRGENDTDARGPFTQDQLSSLVEAQQVDGSTLYYDAALEQWVPISTNESLMAFLFPEKKKLKVRPKDDIETLNVEQAGDAPIRVEDMLAAAEGRTADSHGRIDPKITAERVAGVSRYMLILTLLLSMFAMFFAGDNLTALYSFDLPTILTSPFILLGVVDVFFVIVLLLGATTFYPVVRFRALFAVGLLCFMFFLTGEYQLMIAVGAGTIGMYFMTLAISWTPLIPAALLGLGGMAALAYFRVFV
ncbi:MAG TPA: hypothetical protein VK178_09670 [Opitutaceae bacterium]|nr:hypothetical protein [Opitutaceae bacterium]